MSALSVASTMRISLCPNKYPLFVQTKTPPRSNEKTPQIPSIIARVIGLWNKSTTVVSKYYDVVNNYYDIVADGRWSKNTVVREAAMIGGSALCAGITTLVAEYALNGVTYPFRQEWTSLNPAGMALFVGATVPVFQLTNKFFRPATYSNGVKKTEHFSLQDMSRMSKHAFIAYMSSKVFEVGISALSYLTYFLGTAHAEHPFLNVGFGLASYYLLKDGIIDMQAPEQDAAKEAAPSRRWTKFQIYAGATGLAYTILNTFYQYAAALPVCTVYKPKMTLIDSSEEMCLCRPLPSDPAKPSQPSSYDCSQPLDQKTCAAEVEGPCVWSWNYLGAQGMASRSAVAQPIDLVMQQIFSRFFANKKIPEIPRKLMEFSYMMTGLFATSTVGHYIGLPGCQMNPLSNPIEMIKNVAFCHFLFYGIHKVSTEGISFIFPERTSEVTSAEKPVEKPVDLSGLLHPYDLRDRKRLVPATR